MSLLHLTATAAAAGTQAGRHQAMAPMLDAGAAHASVRKKVGTGGAACSQLRVQRTMVSTREASECMHGEPVRGRLVIKGPAQRGNGAPRIQTTGGPERPDAEMGRATAMGSAHALLEPFALGALAAAGAGRGRPDKHRPLMNSHHAQPSAGARALLGFRCARSLL